MSEPYNAEAFERVRPLLSRYEALIRRADAARARSRGPAQERLWEHDAFDDALSELRRQINEALRGSLSGARGHNRARAGEPAVAHRRLRCAG